MTKNSQDSFMYVQIKSWLRALNLDKVGEKLATSNLFTQKDYRMVSPIRDM